ncbi:MAG: hypothetical protein ACR2O6_10180 [Ilumatobacteraceae bacterium]
MRTAVLAAAAVLSLAAACSSSGDSPEVESATPVTGDGDPQPPVATTLATEPPEVAVAAGPPIVDGVANSLILVHDPDGDDVLAAYRADGTQVTSYVSDESVWHPIWAPDGRRLAWTTSTDGVVWDLVSVAVGGGDETRHPLPGRPDYITFDPTAERILALTPSPQGFGLVIVEVGDPESEGFGVVDVGAPYFSDFAPDGRRVVAHVADDLRVVDLDGGEQQPFDETSFGHQTPAWHPTDDVVFFAADGDDGNRLVARDLTAGTAATLATFDAFLYFDVDPTATRIAVSALAAFDDGDLQALRRRQSESVGAGVWIVDVGDGTTTRVADEPAAAPMWDPTGTRVLVRTAVGGTGRWDVYDMDGSRTGTADFDVDGSLLSAYLPFWDQYARSQTLWSPDGGQFVHVGRSGDGQFGVWIHDADTSGSSTFLVDGDLAFWSPT